MQSRTFNTFKDMAQIKSDARVSEILNGKSEPSLKIGRELSRQLNIDPAVVLGV